MAEVNPRTFPIALVLVGSIIISVAVYACAFGEHENSILTGSLIIFGALMVLLAVAVYVWERTKYYENRKDIHL